VTTGGRIEKGTHQPQRGQPRHWRTRQDPLAEVWESELVPMLEQTPELQPMTLFEYLQAKYPGKYDKSKLRTLQKRVQQWKATAGPPKEVMFEQQHRPGEMGLSDFTELLNQRCQPKWAEEKLHLQTLPVHRLADYEVISVRVTSHSTITVRCILYTVPSQLIGQRLTVHLYQDRLLGFCGNQRVVELTRIYAPAHNDKRRARSVNYRHVIDSLRRKPRAFLQYRWREDLLPNEHYRRIWQQLVAQFNPDIACRLMVESLYIAAVQDKEYLVALWVEGQLRAQTLTLLRLQQQFHSPPTKTSFDTSTVAQHSLSSYDQLLHHQSSEYSHCQPTATVEITAPVPHAAAMADP